MCPIHFRADCPWPQDNNGQDGGAQARCTLIHVVMRRVRMTRSVELQWEYFHIRIICGMPFALCLLPGTYYWTDFIMEMR